MNKIYISAGGTYGFLAIGQSLRKVTLATGASTSLSNDREYTALVYGGNSVLYGVYNGAIGIINQTTGAFTEITKVHDQVDNLVYKDVDEVWFTTQNSLGVINTGTGVITWLTHSL